MTVADNHASIPIIVSTAAARPAAGTLRKSTVHFATDTGNLSVSDGVGTWYAIPSVGIRPVMIELIGVANGVAGLDTNNVFTASMTYTPVTPATLTGDVNDYDLGNGKTFRLSSDALRNITGLAGGVGGREILLFNVGANTIVLQNQNIGSAAANRIITGTGLDVLLLSDDSAKLSYDGVTQRWRLVT